MPKSTEPTSEYVTLDDIIRSLMKFLIIAFVMGAVFFCGYVAYGAVSYWNNKYSENVAIHTPKYKTKEALLYSFCANRQFDTQDDCMNAREYLKRPLSHYVFEATVQDHLKNLPFYSYCTEQSDCHVYVILILETMRSYSGLGFALIGLFILYFAVTRISSAFYFFFSTLQTFTKDREMRLPMTDTAPQIEGKYKLL